MATFYDATGLAVTEGATVQGFGLHNAGRHYTVKQLGTIAGRALLEEYLTGRTFWTFLRYYRVVA